MITQILERFGIRGPGIRIGALGNHGGFSGAELWRIDGVELDTSGGRAYCLRKWPGGISESGRVKRIHRLLTHAVKRGFDEQLIPVPIRLVGYPVAHRNASEEHAETMLLHDGSVYELTPWLPGRADFHDNPRIERIKHAAETLARFHLAIEDFTGHAASSPQDFRFPETISSSGGVNGLQVPGIRKRLQAIDELEAGVAKEIGQRIRGTGMERIGTRILDCYHRLRDGIRHRLTACGAKRFHCQFCIRDIWHDHLLFEGDQVSGIIDFGAIDIDSVAADLSRLFGSLFQNRREFWQTGLESYQSIRELSADELQLIDDYDRSTTMLAGMNWLKWIFVENRKFESLVPIIKRMELLSQRMVEWI